jgi:site-specific recombinase XerD
MDKITAQFIQRLQDSGVSKITLKNYKSDINDFSNWLINEIKPTGAMPVNLQEAVPFIAHTIASKYKSYLNKNNSENTTNRRLSTLRKLAAFLYEANYLNFNFCENLKNLSTEPQKSDKYLMRFEKYLISQKISKNTLKNYLSDIRQFEHWYVTQHNQNN